MNYVLVSVSGGIISEVYFYAGVYSPEGMIAMQRIFWMIMIGMLTILRK
jgi:hypothetical protein